MNPMNDDLVEQYMCEECGGWRDAPPASRETYPGVEGEVELWFCGECTRYER